MIKNLQTLLDRMRDHAGASRSPVSGSFEITARCNLRCGMCYICNPSDARTSELSAGQWLDIIRQARDSGMLFAMLTGGEPLIREDFWEIYLEARKLGLFITLNTNAAAITPGVADLLAKYPPIRVAVTVYGASPEGYERVTGSASAYEKVVRGIDLLRERNINLRLRTTITKDTLPEAGDIARMILSRGFQPTFTNYIMPSFTDNGNDPKSRRLSPDELIEASAAISRAVSDYRELHGDTLEKDRSERESELEADRRIPLNPEQMEFHRLAEERRKNSAFFCQAGLTHFWVTYDGFMTMCGLSREPAFSLRDMTVGEAFDRLGKDMEDIPSCPECEGCTHKYVCSPCPAKLFCENGRYDLKAEYLCSFAKANITVRE